MLKPVSCYTKEDSASFPVLVIPDIFQRESLFPSFPTVVIGNPFEDFSDCYLHKHAGMTSEVLMPTKADGGRLDNRGEDMTTLENGACTLVFPLSIKGRWGFLELFAF